MTCLLMLPEHSGLAKLEAATCFFRWSCGGTITIAQMHRTQHTLDPYPSFAYDLHLVLASLTYKET